MTLSTREQHNRERLKKQKEEIRRYLETGDSDMLAYSWPGDRISACKQAKLELREALIAEVRRRVNGRPLPEFPDLDLPEFSRQKVEPMVRGLFPTAESDIVMALLENSVVFLTPENIGDILHKVEFSSTAWDLANLYLSTAGAELLGQKARTIVGLSEETTCYISVDYFHQQDKFADFLVHEAAHVFHNCKRAPIGLKETRTREFLLNVEYRWGRPPGQPLKRDDTLPGQLRRPLPRRGRLAHSSAYSAAPSAPGQVYRAESSSL